MTYIEAKNIAEEYIINMGEVSPGFRFGLGDEKEFKEKYYFDFIWLTIDGQQPPQLPWAGGAQGLTIHKQDKKVELASHGDYCALVQEELELTKMYQLLVDFKSTKINLTEIKYKFNLTSKQLLYLSKLIMETEISKEKTFEILKDVLDKVKNKR